MSKHLSRREGFEHDAREAEFLAFLAATGSVDTQSIERALIASQHASERLDRVLLKLALVSEEKMLSLMSEFFCIPICSKAELPSEHLLSDYLTEEFLMFNHVFPLKYVNDCLHLAVVDPFDTAIMEAIAFACEIEVKPLLISYAQFEELCSSIFSKNVATDQDSQLPTSSGQGDVDVQRLKDLASEAPVIKLANLILHNAVEQRASDVHIEPEVDSVVVRYRIDGILKVSETLKAGLKAALSSRFKIMAQLDIAERRLPQDGRLNMAVRGKDVSFRVSTMPTRHGESIVLRVLDQSRVELDFDVLGFDAAAIERLKWLSGLPNGIVLVTGPTGSGKTTTLYTLIKNLDRNRQKIFTVEDPVEHHLKGVCQIQVQPAIGFDFPDALRSVLRQDPDVIMIGEIRDAETARIAIRAALTGHLVFATLHTNSAASAITRLIDMGIEDYLLASTLKGVLSQRLVRKRCPCSLINDDVDVRVSSHGSIREIHRNGLQTGSKLPDDCFECARTGFLGRSTIYELLVANDEISAEIRGQYSEKRVEELAVEGGMTPILENGLAKVDAGIAIAGDVLSVVGH